MSADGASPSSIEEGDELDAPASAEPPHERAEQRRRSSIMRPFAAAMSVLARNSAARADPEHQPAQPAEDSTTALKEGQLMVTPDDAQERGVDPDDAGLGAIAPRAELGDMSARPSRDFASQSDAEEEDAAGGRDERGSSSLAEASEPMVFMPISGRSPSSPRAVSGSTTYHV